MRVGDYELWVCKWPESDAEDDINGEVELEHGQVYMLVLFNHNNLRCDASVLIDGKHVGTWRVLPNNFVGLTRSVHHEGRFTFFRLDSSEAKAANVPTDGTAGWIEARFVPEAETKGKLFDGHTLNAAAPSDDEAEEVGGTGYTGKSEQTFRNADDIYSFDEAAAVTVKLRLKCKKPLFDDDEPFDLRGEASSSLEQIATAQRHHLANLPDATFERVTFVAIDCPDCGKQSRVPVGSGSIRIKCPHCSRQFVRET